MANFSITFFSAFLLQIIVSGIALGILEDIDLAGKVSTVLPDLSRGPNTGVQPPSIPEIEKNFQNFIGEYNKIYMTVYEKEMAFKNFYDNYLTIWNHNQIPTKNYTLGIYDTMDQAGLTKPLGFNPENMPSEILDQALYLPPELYNSAIPDTWDWRNYGAVTSVKDQGQCGSCWAFSSVGALEGARFVAGGPLVSLSEQELLDCVSDFDCTTGGYMIDAFIDVEKNGLGEATCYPYNGLKAGTCGRTQSCQEVTPGQVKDIYTVHPGDEEELRQLVYHKGPVSIAVYVDDIFTYYQSGIMLLPTCNLPPNHAVLVVGYGREGGLDYWIVKNSWGAGWGEGGYFRMQRNTVTLNLGFDYCGITSYAVTPKMD